MQNLSHTLKEIAHDAVAIVGILSMCVGVITLALQAAGLTVTNDQVSGFLVVAGGIATTFSKMIDSWNNAQTAIEADEPE